MPPKSTLEAFFSCGARQAAPPTHCTSAIATTTPAPSAHLVMSQLPLRERILQQCDKGLFLDHKQRAMGIAFDNTSGIYVETMEFRLMCPYAQTRIRVPVRSDACHHVQCCDLDSWVSLFSKFKAMRDPAAPCPVCNQRVMLSSLRVDEWMVVVLRNLPEDRIVLLGQDGSYRSGDVHRVVKRQREEEVVAATQLSLSRDRDDGDVEYFEPRDVEQGMCDETQDSLAPPHAGGTTMSGHHDGIHLCPVKVEPTVVGGHVKPTEEEAEPPTVAAVLGQNVNPAPEISCEDSKPTNLLSFFGVQKRRALPAGWRRWSPYCPRCLVNCIHAEHDDVKGHVQYDGDDAVFTCPRCRSEQARCLWPAVRKFFKRRSALHWQASLSTEAESQNGLDSTTIPHVSLEVTDDGTTIVSGLRQSIGPLGHYLLRGNFTLCEVETSKQIVSWFSSCSLVKSEIDFLETVCDAAAQGEDPTDFNGVAPFRFKFRYEKKQWGSGGPGPSMYTQQSAAVYSPPAATHPQSPIAASTSAAPDRSGSFRIQVSR